MQKRSLMMDYARVTEANPCPVCGRPDWCLIHKDGHGAICQRERSDKPKGKAGWYHDVDTEAPAYQAPKPKLSPDDLKQRIKRLALVRPFDAEQLNLPLGALQMMGARWDADRKCVVFPMTDGLGHVVGARLRWHNGDKRSITGGTEGVFTSRRPITSYVMITEGPTDTAACLGLGHPTIGRPSSNGGLDEIKRLVPDYAHIIILADPDKPGSPARKGVLKLAQDLRGRPVTVLVADQDVRGYVASYAVLHKHKASYQIAAGFGGNPDTWRPIFRSPEVSNSDRTLAMNDIFHAEPLT